MQQCCARGGERSASEGGPYKSVFGDYGQLDQSFTSLIWTVGCALVK
jgi:hypothetical protein